MSFVKAKFKFLFISLNPAIYKYFSSKSCAWNFLDIKVQQTKPWNHSKLFWHIIVHSSVSYPYDSVVCITTFATFCSVFKQAISPFCKDIWRSTAMVNGEIRDFHELLIGEDAKKKGKGRDADHCPRESFKVDFMMPLVSSWLLLVTVVPHGHLY